VMMSFPKQFICFKKCTSIFIMHGVLAMSLRLHFLLYMIAKGLANRLIVREVGDSVHQERLWCSEP
jgi:hypothetical protein